MPPAPRNSVPSRYTAPEKIPNELWTACERYSKIAPAPAYRRA